MPYLLFLKKAKFEIVVLQIIGGTLRVKQVKEQMVLVMNSGKMVDL